MGKPAAKNPRKIALNQEADPNVTILKLTLGPRQLDSTTPDESALYPKMSPNIPKDIFDVVFLV